MKPSLAAEAIGTCLSAQQPVFVWGAPGIGKSAIVAQVARARNLALRDVRAVLLDPVDLRGIPHLNGDNRTHWATPEFLPRDGAGVLFLDELNAAPPLVQAACYQLVLDRQIGEYRLPDGWQVIAAGNRASDRAVVHEMPTALRNRFVHLTVEADCDDWSTWAIAAGVSPVVVAFLRWRPELLHQFDRNATAFASPRSWEFAARILAASPSAAVEHALLSGTVGEGPAVELSAFLRIYRELPSIDAILMNPHSAPIPQQPAALYAVAAALAHRATSGNIDQVIGYADRLPREFGVMCVRDTTRRDPVLASSNAFIRWSVANQSILS